MSPRCWPGWRQSSRPWSSSWSSATAALEPQRRPVLPVAEDGLDGEHPLAHLGDRLVPPAPEPVLDVGADLTAEIRSGSHERLLVSPLSRPSLLVGRALKEVVPVLYVEDAARGLSFRDSTQSGQHFFAAQGETTRSGGLDWTQPLAKGENAAKQSAGCDCEAEKSFTLGRVQGRQLRRLLHGERPQRDQRRHHLRTVQRLSGHLL